MALSVENFSIPSPKAKPKSLVCYICGREFGTKSLKIHLKTCVQKWEWEEGKKPKKERRPLPVAPPELDELLSKETLEWEEMSNYNTQASEKFNNESLVKCEFCNRTFFDHRMAGHRKICTKDRPANPLPEKFQTSTSLKERNRCKSLPKFREAEDCLDSRKEKENVSERPLIILKEITEHLELKNSHRNSIIYENQQEEHDDNLPDKIPDAFVIPSITTNPPTKEDSPAPKEDAVNDKEVVTVPLDKKFTESALNKIRSAKKKESKFENSPKPRLKADQAAKEPKHGGETKTNESPNQKTNGLETKKCESSEKKEKDGENIDGKLRTKTVMKATQSFLKKIAGDRKKSAVDGFYRKKDSGIEENVEEIVKKKEFTKEENDEYYHKYAKRKYKIFTREKTVDFNY